MLITTGLKNSLIDWENMSSCPRPRRAQKSSGGDFLSGMVFPKMVEKPSKNNYFILGSMDDSGIPEAVRNRCVTYRLKLLTMKEISDRLAYICEKEGIVIDTEEKANIVLTIAQNSQGSLRTAISYLERCIQGDSYRPWSADIFPQF